MNKRPDYVIQQAAYAAWMRGGSMSLGLWLADMKERTTGRRYFTVAEVATWVAFVKDIELRVTGMHREFAEGRDTDDTPRT